MQQLRAAEELLEWLRSSGGVVHPSLELRQDAQTGLGAFTSSPIPPDEHLISCPFDLAITSPLATQAICSVAGIDESQLDGWNDRMRIVTYLFFHHIFQNFGDWPASLKHQSYVNSLPSPTGFLTALFFNDIEVELLRGTNMYGAIEEQRALWEAESERVKATLKNDRLTRAVSLRYLITATLYQSRAFPSKLLHLTQNSADQVNDAIAAADMDESYPILLPGVDIMNHARAQPITWLSTSLSTSSGPVPSVVVLNRETIPANTEIFNNYGPKSNEELLFSYGFVLNPNPDDTVSLRLGTSTISAAVQSRLRARGLDAGQKFVLRWDGVIPQDLLKLMRIMMGQSDEDESVEEQDDPHAEHEKEVRGLELELDVLGALGGMLEDKLAKLPATDGSGEGAREEVVRMVGVYVRGQGEILEAAMNTVSDRIDQLEKMLDQGMGGCSCCS